MKIRCTKQEFVQMIEDCAESRGGGFCYRCALQSLCEGESTLADFVDDIVMEEDAK